jgi:hypothetical protein
VGEPPQPLSVVETRRNQAPSVPAEWLRPHRSAWGMFQVREDEPMPRVGAGCIEYRWLKQSARQPVRRRTRSRGDCERLPDYCTCEDQNRRHHPDCAKRVSRALSEEPLSKLDGAKDRIEETYSQAT